MFTNFIIFWSFPNVFPVSNLSVQKLFPFSYELWSLEMPNWAWNKVEIMLVWNWTFILTRFLNCYFSDGRVERKSANVFIRLLFNIVLVFHHFWCRNFTFTFLRFFQKFFRKNFLTSHLALIVNSNGLLARLRLNLDDLNCFFVHLLKRVLVYTRLQCFRHCLIKDFCTLNEGPLVPLRQQHINTGLWWQIFSILNVVHMEFLYSLRININNSKAKEKFKCSTNLIT